MKYKVSLFFGYQNRNAISRTIDIKEDYLSIWVSALLLKTKSMQIKNNGMELSELNEMMNISPRSNIVEVVSNIVVSKGSTNIVRTSYDIDSEIIALDLYNKILKVNPTFKGDYKKWIPDIEKMIRIDKRDILDIQNCLNWIYNDKKGSFWIPNILSGKKLREKFDTMKIQIVNKPKSTLDLSGKTYDCSRDDEEF